jgi:lysozyme family protein
VTERYKSFFDELLKNEGGYSDDPDDTGGKTIYGISKNNFPAAYKVISEIYFGGNKSQAKNYAMEFYHKNFYNPLYDNIQDVQVAFRVFDFGVNAGVKRAVKILQKTVNQFGFRLAEDGIFGKGTLVAVNDVGALFYPAYEKSIEGFYRSLSTFWKFGKGWLNRLRRRFVK